MGGITFINSKLSKHGVAIIVRKIALNFKIREIELNQIMFKNRICHVQIQTKETVNIINVYAPSGDDQDKVTFFRSLQDYLSLYKSSTIILLGDFNYVLDNNDRINHLLPYDKKIHNVFQPQKLGLMDTFGKIHGDKRKYTYQTARLDRIYITQCMVTKIRSIEHLYKEADHKIVELKIDIENQNILGKYYWKIFFFYFNDSYYRN